MRGFLKRKWAGKVQLDDVKELVLRPDTDEDEKMLRALAVWLFDGGMVTIDTDEEETQWDWYLGNEGVQNAADLNRRPGESEPHDDDQNEDL